MAAILGGSDLEEEEGEEDYEVGDEEDHGAYASMRTGHVTLRKIAEAHPEATAWVFVGQPCAQSWCIEAVLAHDDSRQWKLQCRAHNAVEHDGGSECTGGNYWSPSKLMESHGIGSRNWRDKMRVRFPHESENTPFDELRTVAAALHAERDDDDDARDDTDEDEAPPAGGGGGTPHMTLNRLVEMHHDARTWTFVVQSSASPQLHVQAVLECDLGKWQLECLEHPVMSGGCDGGQLWSPSKFVQVHGTRGRTWREKVRIRKPGVREDTPFEQLPTAAEVLSKGAVTTPRTTPNRPQSTKRKRTGAGANSSRKRARRVVVDMDSPMRREVVEHAATTDGVEDLEDPLQRLREEASVLLSLPLQRWQPEHTPQVSIGEYKATRAAFFVRRALRVQAWLRDEAVKLRALARPPPSPRFESAEQYMAHVRALPVDAMVERMDALAADTDSVALEDLSMFVDAHVFVRELVPLCAFAAV